MGDGRYKVTSEVFAGDAAEQFRRAVLDSPSLQGSGFGEIQLFGLAARVEAVCSELVESLKAYGEAHQGEAAEAAQSYIAGLVLTGLHGHEKLTGMAYAMHDQTGSFANVHRSMQDAGERLSGVVFAAGWAQEDAGNIATSYQASTNEGINRSLPVFDPPPAASVSSQVVDPAGVPGAGSAGARLGAVDAGLAPASAGVPTEVAGIPGGAGGVGSGGVGPGGGVGALGSLPVSPAADLGRGSGSPPVLPGVSGVPGYPGSSSGSGPGVAPYSGTSGRWGTQEGLGPRTTQGGVIRPGMPRGGAVEGEPAPRPRSTAASEGQPRSGLVRGSTPQGGGTTPLMPGAAGAGAGRGGSSRRRPDWLIESDPDSYWLADIPPHGPAVIRPSDDDDFDDFDD